MKLYQPIYEPFLIQYSIWDLYFALLDDTATLQRELHQLELVVRGMNLNNNVVRHQMARGKCRIAGHRLHPQEMGIITYYHRAFAKVKEMQQVCNDCLTLFDPQEEKYRFEAYGDTHRN